MAAANDAEMERMMIRYWMEKAGIQIPEASPPPPAPQAAPSESTGSINADVLQQIMTNAQSVEEKETDDAAATSEEKVRDDAAAASDDKSEILQHKNLFLDEIKKELEQSKTNTSLLSEEKYKEIIQTLKDCDSTDAKSKSKARNDNRSRYYKLRKQYMVINIAGKDKYLTH
jgi:hypothetical protein